MEREPSLRRLGTIIEVGLAVLLLTGATAAQALRLEGAVQDRTGAVVAGARVELRAGAASMSCNTDANGNFFFASVEQRSGLVLVRATGFATVEQHWTAATGAYLRLEIVLTPATVEEQVVVTAARIETRLSDVAGSAVALSFEDINATPALLADDKLRQVPGFTLFRRSDSRTANPTSQGVSLRGLGASGASRALVLEDGIPLNDPFGGWVYWSRIPQQALASVELVRGGISSLYGSNALGGVIQFLSRQQEKSPAMSLETSYGSERTPDLSLWAGGRAGGWDAEAAADLFRSDGYVLVPVAKRGRVDQAANSEHATVDLTLGRRFADHGRVFGRGTFFREARNNGTAVQTNDTAMAQGAAGADSQLGPLASIALRVYGDAQGYNQNFSSVAADRMSESLTNLQHVPVQQMGGSGLWSRSRGRAQSLVAGVDAGEVMGWSQERTFSSGTQTATSLSGGRQRTVGVFGEYIFRIRSQWIVTAGARFDDWRNFDAQTLRIPAIGPKSDTRFPDRAESALSPRLSMLRTLTHNLSLTASIYRAFRSPTLNELYRSFRLGNTVTQANSDLRAERLTGAEAGGNAFAFDRKLNVRGNFFWEDIVNPIANVPISVTSALTTQRRENLGRTRSRGLDLDAVLRLGGPIEISSGYQFVDATVVQAPAFATLVGMHIPETPGHQFTVQARYWDPTRLMVSVQGRYSGSQFDDASNTLLLDHYFTLDLLAGRSLGHGIEMFAALENLLNQRYNVSLTAVANQPLLPTLSPPFLARVGLRLNYPTRR